MRNSFFFHKISKAQLHFLTKAKKQHRNYLDLEIFSGQSWLNKVSSIKDHYEELANSNLDRLLS